MEAAYALGRLARLDSSLIAFLTIFAPLYSRTGDWIYSFQTAIPMLFIAICTFVANDLDDLESDIINHPERPLPSGSLSESLAATIYFVSLALALLLIRAWAGESTGTSTLYYLLLVLVISYHYVVDYFPGFKAPYVAGTSAMPVVIVAHLQPEGKLWTMVPVVFLFMLGRELCMDFVDREGDAETFIHRLSSEAIATIAFSTQGIGLLLILTLLSSPGNLLAWTIMCILSAFAMFYWRTDERRTIRLMKLQLAIGLYFLL